MRQAGIRGWGGRARGCRQVPSFARQAEPCGCWLVALVSLLGPPPSSTPHPLTTTHRLTGRGDAAAIDSTYHPRKPWRHTPR
eukprot:scaffold84_cov124-Isochrysis_galbana.AAC.3